MILPLLSCASGLAPFPIFRIPSGAKALRVGGRIPTSEFLKPYTLHLPPYTMYLFRSNWSLRPPSIAALSLGFKNPGPAVS